MRRILISSFLLASTAYSAVAADLPSVKAAPVYVPPAPVFTWTGFYLGVYGGGVFGTTHVTGPAFVPGVSNAYNQNPTGGAVGGLVGYNFQFNPNWVIGLEGEGGWQGFTATNTFVSAANGLPFTQQVTTDYSARIRGRLGYAFADRALLFVAGGVSFSDIGVQLNNLIGSTTKVTQGLVGWNIGGGLDYAFTPNWIGRIEYIYDDYGSTNYGFIAKSGNVFDDRSATFQSSTVRGAIIYKFGAPAAVPVVAKY
ncbi:outer membrane immunogenic protein [Rhodoblastus acidophilus]|uniref:outer membrane protein n=1 Tax=Rhodoblastus acidophilus TaxID=1074 RepID=UPI0022256D17|nr:outer membrane beta-barrel protein [Rhodoblastus acidophilus]MCW2285017.1 outer membrane immunogenic protein [Rhodoblastus acidophilus]MCW2333919.1 outer membrane immunogenic protein [Rhodoblastus acidophilus]